MQLVPIGIHSYGTCFLILSTKIGVEPILCSCGAKPEVAVQRTMQRGSGESVEAGEKDA